MSEDGTPIDGLADALARIEDGTYSDWQEAVDTMMKTLGVMAAQGREMMPDAWDAMAASNQTQAAAVSSIVRFGIDENKPADEIAAAAVSATMLFSFTQIVSSAAMFEANSKTAQAETLAYAGAMLAGLADAIISTSAL